MKKIKFIILTISVISICSCQKQPAANFTTDKASYIAGDIIHCFDVSNDAYSSKWTTPDGKNYYSEHILIPTDSNDMGGIKTITLEVGSKNGSKTDIISKSFIVNQYILPTDYFSLILPGPDEFFKPISKICGYKAGDNTVNDWQISAGNGSGEGPHDYIDHLWIYFPEITAPIVSGAYNLQYDNHSLTSGNACIRIKFGSDDTVYLNYFSTSGQVNISFTYNGKIHAVFNNINAMDGAGNPAIISGDITCSN